MAMNKKGVLFTFAAVIMISVISASTGVVLTGYLSEAQVNIVRLQTLSNFADGIDDDFRLVLYASAFRSLVAMQEEIATSGAYIDDVGLRVEELMLDGQLYGINNTFLINNTVPSWIERVEAKAQNIGLTIDVNVTDIDIGHYDPWNITVNVTYQIWVNDTKGIASFTSTRNQTSIISILGFLEPLSIRETNNKVVAAINVTPFEGDFAANMEEHIEDEYFANWTGAPSYLMRLEGNFSASPYGIERLVDKVALADNDFTIDTDASSADYQYWGSASVGSAFSVGTAFFKLDNETSGNLTHIDRYNLSDYVVP